MMILANRIMDNMFEEIRPVLHDWVANRREFAAAYGIRLPRQEDPAEKGTQVRIDVLKLPIANDGLFMFLTKEQIWMVCLRRASTR